MNLKSQCLFLAAALYAAGTRGAAEEPLRYQFNEGATNGYRITLESPSERKGRKYEGVVILIVKSAEENAATIQMQGHFRPAGGVGGPMFMPGHPMNPWRFTPLQPFSEARVDRQGRVLRTLAIPELPKLLQNYAEVLFPAFPEKYSAEWQNEAHLKVPEDTVMPGPGGPRGMPRPGFHMGHPFGGAGELSGTRTDTTEVVEAGPRLIRLRKESHFRTWMKTVDEPRLELTTRGEILFDRESGALESLTLEGQSVTSTPDYLLRTPLRLRVERVRGEELAQAMARGPAPAEAVKEEELPALLEDLKGEDPARRSEAAQRLLASNAAEEFGEQLLDAVKPLALNEDHSLRRLVGAALANAATVEDLPLLLRLLEKENIGSHHQVIQALKRLQDKRSIEPLAELIARGSGSAHEAARALGEFGPAAEPAALALLEESHVETRRLACEILRECGTARALEALQAVIAEGESSLLHTAAEAIRSIRARGETAEKLDF